jgi:hypothetical protein
MLKQTVLFGTPFQTPLGIPPKEGGSPIKTISEQELKESSRLTKQRSNQKKTILQNTAGQSKACSKHYKTDFGKQGAISRTECPSIKPKLTYGMARLHRRSRIKCHIQGCPLDNPFRTSNVPPTQ